MRQLDRYKKLFKLDAYKNVGLAQVPQVVSKSIVFVEIFFVAQPTLKTNFFYVQILCYPRFPPNPHFVTYRNRGNVPSKRTKNFGAV